MDEPTPDLIPDPNSGPVRRRILQSTSALPSLVTLGNGIAGFAAIHFATKPLPPEIIDGGQGAAEAWVAGNLVLAAWFILGGMVCDALDGRLARITGQTSEFGAQLDSLCDAVTFGIAPALLMLRTVQAELFPIVGEVDILPRAAVAGRAVWFIAAVYASCAILRLARFNVENQPDLSSHMEFRGLPSPAAAMSVASLVLFHGRLATVTEGWRTARWPGDVTIWAIPAITLAAALLMVSQLRYAHLANRYLQGRRPFGYIVAMVFVILAGLAYFREALVVVSTVYVFSGPADWLIRRRGRRQG